MSGIDSFMDMTAFQIPFFEWRIWEGTSLCTNIVFPLTKIIFQVLSPNFWGIILIYLVKYSYAFHSSISLFCAHMQMSIFLGSSLFLFLHSSTMKEVILSSPNPPTPPKFTLQKLVLKCSTCSNNATTGAHMLSRWEVGTNGPLATDKIKA